MTDKQHTPTPFKLECLGSEGYQIRLILNKSLSELKIECGGLNEKFYDRVHPIATLYGEFFQQKANAEFIVKACNNYDKLVEAVKVALWDGEHNEADAQHLGHPRLIERNEIYRQVLKEVE